MGVSHKTQTAMNIAARIRPAFVSIRERLEFTDIE